MRALMALIAAAILVIGGIIKQSPYDDCEVKVRQAKIVYGVPS